MINKWDFRFMEIANIISTWSKDNSTKVGSLIVKDKRILTTGFNGFPSGINDYKEDRLIRPKKYLYTIHAETNAILQASQYGLSLEGSTIYVTNHPCANCTALIIQSGIKRIVTYNIRLDKDFDKRWKESILIGIEMITEKGIQIDYMEKV